MFVTPGSRSKPRVTSRQLAATPTSDSANLGKMGEYLETVLAAGSATSLATGTAKNIVTLNLTSGDWEVSGNVVYVPAATTSVTLAFHSISAVSSTQDQVTFLNGFAIYRTAAFVPAANFTAGNVGPVRKSLSGTTTMYLVAQATFTVSTMTAHGTIRARRAR